MISVLHINKFYYPHIGGVETVVQDLVENLDKKHFVCSVLACKSSSNEASTETINDIIVLKSRTFLILKSTPISFQFFIDFFKNFRKYQIIHIHEPFPLGSLICWALPKRFKLVVTWHSDIVRQRFLKYLLVPFQWLTLMRAEAIIATSENMKINSFIRFFKNKVEVIQLSIPDFIFNEDSKTPQRHFLFVGRLVYYKGVFDLLHAAKSVKYPLIIIGDGPLREEVLDQIHENKLNHVKLIKGPIDRADLNEYFKSALAFVFPSNETSEAFGIVQLEAMAAGKPVINTLLKTGVPEVSLDRETGITVPVNSPKELAQAMREILDNEETRFRMGKKARKRVKEHFVHSVTIPKYEKLYERLASCIF